MTSVENLVFWCAWFLAVVLRTNVNGEEEIGSPLRIAQCRAHCILKFSTELESQRTCFQEPDCFMCWENCQLLQANYPIWGGICSETGICFPGCQEACRFHREMSPVQQTVPVIRTRGEEVIFVKNQTAYWPKPSRQRHDAAADPVVYVVMRRLPGKMWRQIIQTLETSSRVPEDLSSGALLRVLVVHRDGLLTIYSPVASDSSLRSATDIARSTGQNGLQNTLSDGKSSNATDKRTSAFENGSSSGRRINTEITRTASGSKNATETVNDAAIAVEYTTWNLREISLIHQKVLVIAEIAWDAVPAYAVLQQRPVYFVTWEVDGGGLKGNLFTDSTCVTLSLWPDTVYHIQVELVGHNVALGRPQQSEDFLLDTHHAVAVELETSSPELPILTVTQQPSGDGFVDEDDGAMLADSNEIASILDSMRQEEQQQHRRNYQMPHRIDIVAQKQQGDVLLAVGTAFAVFVIVLVVLVYASCRHSDVLSHPRLNNDIFALKPDKKLNVDCSNVPKEFVPILTLISENISKKSTKLRSADVHDSRSAGGAENDVVRTANQKSGARWTTFEEHTNVSHATPSAFSKLPPSNNVRFGGCNQQTTVYPFQPYYCDRNSSNDSFPNREVVS